MVAFNPDDVTVTIVKPEGNEAESWMKDAVKTRLAWLKSEPPVKEEFDNAGDHSIDISVSWEATENPPKIKVSIYCCSTSMEFAKVGRVSIILKLL